MPRIASGPCSETQKSHVVNEAARLTVERGRVVSQNEVLLNLIDKDIKLQNRKAARGE
tara:strand:+ start:1092 stop:1265 length:174 start_codon:yes stop_codon:yes gene_type:complete